MNGNIKRRSFLKALAAIPLLIKGPEFIRQPATNHRHRYTPGRSRYITIDATDYDSDSPITITLIREMRDGGI